ncbi:hypothetical protein [Seongchinamella sediminis]|nr:hypothetical protein [Seongchinamella sediminis]
MLTPTAMRLTHRAMWKLLVPAYYASHTERDCTTAQVEQGE